MPRKVLPCLSLCILFLLNPGLARAAGPGDLDASFGSGGTRVVAVSEFAKSPYDGADDLVLQADGKPILIGNYSLGRDESWTQPAHLRFDTDGALDAGWGNGGIAKPDMGDDLDWWIWDGALTRDGKLIVAGDSDATATLVRYTSAGAIDESFGSGGYVRTPGLYRTFASVTPLADGRVLASGAAVMPDGSQHAAVYRFNEDGTLDTGFGDGGRTVFPYGLGTGRSDSARELVVEPDGSIVVFGSASQSRGRGHLGVARLSPAGEVLTRREFSLSANHDWRGDDAVAIRRTPDGGFAVGAMAYAGSATLRDVVVVRLTPALAPDADFDGDGQRWIDIAGDSDHLADLDVQPDGKIVLAIDVLLGQEREVAVMRLRPDGQPDEAFGQGGMSTFQWQGPGSSNSAAAIAVDPREGSIWIGGYSRKATGESYGDFAIAKMLGSFPSLVAITGGPSGVAKGGDATFEFKALTEQPGHYECRLLELAAWEPCVSPKRYGGLADGEHRFEVRYIPDGTPGEEARATDRTWTSDGTPPVAQITQAPSGDGNPDSARFEFDAGEEGATYRCRVDDREEVDCRSPWRVFDLAPGQHVFRVKAADAVGNEQPQATEVSWTVGSGGPGEPPPPPPPPAVQCPGDRLATVSAGPVVVVAATAEGCLQPIPDSKGELDFRATGPVKVNGIGITPRTGSWVHVRREVGDVRLQFRGPFNMTLGAVTLPMPLGFTWNAGNRATTAKFAIPIWEEVLKKVQPAFLGLNWSLSPQFELSADNGGQAKIGLKLELPGLLRSLPTESVRYNDKLTGGLTTELLMTVNNGGGLAYNVKQKLQKAWLFGILELENVGWGVDSGPPLSFEGFGTLKFGTKKIKEAELAIALSLGKGGMFGSALRKASIQASKLNVPIGHGVHLQRVGGDFEMGADAQGNPVPTLSSNGGLSLGPRLDLKPLFEGEAVSLDGKIKWTGGTPWSIEGSGEAKIIEVPVAGMTARYTSSGRIDLSGKVDLSIGGYGVLGEIKDGWATEQDFSVDALGEIRLPGGLISGAEAVLSKAGMAVCYGPPGGRIGFGQRWGQLVRPMVVSCDVGPYRRVAPAATASAARAGAGAAKAAGNSFDVPDAAKVHVVTVTGDGAPPKVELSGPGGARVATPAGPQLLRTDGALVVQDPKAATTSIVLFGPAGGRWTISAQPGSAPVTDVRTAAGLPPVGLRVRASGSGARRTLTWRMNGRAGQRVRIVERGADGARTLLATAKARGRLRFRPGTGRRTLLAIVEQDGVPRMQRVVASFTGPSGRLRKPGALRLAGRGLRWRGQPAASRYALELRYRDGTVTALTAERARARLPKGCRGRIRVTALALDAAGRPGPAKTASLRCRAARR